MSNATVNATGAAKLFATEKNLPVYGAFPLPLTTVPAAAWRSGKTDFELRHIGELRRKSGFRPKILSSRK